MFKPIAIAMAMLFPALAHAQTEQEAENQQLCTRGGMVVVEGFKRENPNLAPDFFHLENVRLAFPTTDGVICQADFVFSDPRIATRNQTFPVRPAENGKIKICNRQGQCTDPQ